MNELLPIALASALASLSEAGLNASGLPPSPATDPGTRLELVVDSAGLRLHYTVGSPFGTVRIHGAARLDQIDRPESILWSGPVPANGAGTFPLAASPPSPSAFYAVSWDAEVPNPEPGRLAWIAPGAFAMGSSDAEQDRDSDEGPVTMVRLPRGFFISRFETTHEEFLSLMGHNPSCAVGPQDLPVEQVTWEEAREFARRRTERDRAFGRIPNGYVYRLPTEAEWEYAARAGTTTRFSFGDDPEHTALPRHAWFEASGGGAPHSVGLLQPNAWGLHDVHGNVGEWCLDWYGEYPGGSALEPAGPLTGDFPVIRGGSFEDEGAFCRSAFRNYDWTTNRSCSVGFRLVLAPEQAPNYEDRVALVWIPPGRFLMGSPDEEEDRDSDEGPQTLVTISRGFWMGRFEVTQRLFESVMGTNTSFYRGPNRPMEGVSWAEAQEFCDRLTARDREDGRIPAGWRYRLPTEAEWEYVARAGTTTRYHFGEDPDERLLPDYAVYGVAPTLGVGGRRPNPWGVYDLYGNVAEWCLDWYGPYAGGTLADPQGPASGWWRVQRGGSWDHAARYCRSAARGADFPEERFTNVGLRVVLASIPAPPDFSGIDLIAIPPGTFLMGSPDSERGRNDHEGPQTRITFAEGFRIGRFEVTQGEYAAVTGEWPSHFAGLPEQPVEKITWDEAMDFCRRLTETERNAGRLPEGLVYRLSTEAEWEYAARAGSRYRYSFGDDPGEVSIGLYAWFLLNSGASTHPIGRRQPNARGLHDVHGNVAEWCWDWFGPYPGGDLMDSTGPASGERRVIRGGAYDDPADECRSASRLSGAASDRSQGVGFRVVLGRPVSAGLQP